MKSGAKAATRRLPILIVSAWAGLQQRGKPARSSAIAAALASRANRLGIAGIVLSSRSLLARSFVRQAAAIFNHCLARASRPGGIGDFRPDRVLADERDGVGNIVGDQQIGIELYHLACVGQTQDAATVGVDDPVLGDVVGRDLVGRDRLALVDRREIGTEALDDAGHVINE